MTRFKIGILMLLLIIFTSSLDITIRSEGEPDYYKIQGFWDSNDNFFFHRQEASNSCGPASVQMVLHFLQADPLPSQEELAEEMNTTIYEYTYSSHVHKPFRNRGIEIISDTHFPSNFSKASISLKGNISLDRPIIVLMWFNLSKQTGHYRVLVGYNQTGFFCHDPWKGPSIYFDNTEFEILWTLSDNWAFILHSPPPPKPIFEKILDSVRLILQAVWDFISSFWS